MRWFLMLNKKIVQSYNSGKEKALREEESILTIRILPYVLQDTFSLPELFFYFLIKKICKVKLFLYNAATYHKMFS